MLVEYHHKFDAEFPEEFPWECVTSPTVDNATQEILRAIKLDFKSRNRLLVPGLREALRLMAKHAEIYQGPQP